MTDIFLSYAHQDETRIRELVRAFEERGWSIFWDRRIPTGKTWQSHIGENLSDAKCVVVAWSRHSITSEWVIDEANEAKKRGFLMPILLDPVDPPLGFRGIQAADLINWRYGKSSPLFDDLINDIVRIVGLQPLHPSLNDGSNRQGQAIETPNIAVESRPPRGTQQNTIPSRSLTTKAKTTPEHGTLRVIKVLGYGILVIIVFGLIGWFRYWFGAEHSRAPVAPPAATATQHTDERPVATPTQQGSPKEQPHPADAAPEHKKIAKQEKQPPAKKTAPDLATVSRPGVLNSSTVQSGEVKNVDLAKNTLTIITKDGPRTFGVSVKVRSFVANLREGDKVDLRIVDSKVIHVLTVTAK